VLPNGQQVVVVDELPWPKAPEVNGTDIPSVSEVVRPGADAAVVVRFTHFALS
jgi:hypothetical protein